MKRTSLAGLAFAAVLAAAPLPARARGGVVRSAPGRVNFASYNVQSFSGGRGGFASRSSYSGYSGGYGGVRSAGYAFAAPALRSYGGFGSASSFHPMGKAYFSRGFLGVSPAGGAGGAGGSRPGPTQPQNPQQPQQTVAVPGALIRTAGSAPPVYSQPDQGARTFTVAAGAPELNPALADGSANYRQGLFVGAPIQNPTPNPGSSGSGMNPSGYTGITPNGPLYVPGTYGAPGSGGN